MILMWIIGAGVLASVVGVLAAGLFLLFPAQVRTWCLPNLVSYATGALLAAALLALLPEALEMLPPAQVLMTLLFGVLLFFLLEKLIIWRHCHGHECADRHHAAAPLILIGDGVHNFVDGMIVAAAFLVSIPLGVGAALAVIAHEIPQEVGDFAILLESGMSRARALFWNVVSGLATLAGSLVAYFSLQGAQNALPYIMGIAAASFLYVAMSDLVPHLHRQVKLRASVQQMLFIAAGVLTIVLFGRQH